MVNQLAGPLLPQMEESRSFSGDLGHQRQLMAGQKDGRLCRDVPEGSSRQCLAASDFEPTCRSIWPVFRDL